MTTKHTPGPWEVADAGTWKNGIRMSTEYFVRRPEDDVGIANDILDPETSHPSESNARLIAAAPCLLRELENLVRIIGDDWGDAESIKSAHAAIAKATGKDAP